MVVVAVLLLLGYISASMVEDINDDPESTWVAVEYPPEIMSREKLLSRIIRDWVPLSEISMRMDIVGADASFDSRTKWGSLILPVRDQANCGSCWAFAAAETTGDRVGISGGASQVYSPQDLVSCDKSNYACEGGYVDSSWNYVKTKGLALEACIPYQSGSGSVPKCPSTCTNGSSIVRKKATSVYAVSSSKMQTEIQTNGPIEVAFNVYEDFETYKSGVYQHKTGKLLGGHAVVAVGWGVSGSTPYWIVQNSWGPNWGINGYFWIIRGTNNCGIESEAYAGLF